MRLYNFIIWKWRWNRWHRYDINRPIPKHGHKYSKYEKSLSITMLICIKQHLSNIWSWILEKVKQHWGWVEKKRVIDFWFSQIQIYWQVDKDLWLRKMWCWKFEARKHKLQEFYFLNCKESLRISREQTFMISGRYYFNTICLSYWTF